MRGGDGNRARSAVEVIAPITLVSVIVGGAIAVRVFRRVSSCSWYSGAWIGLAAATGLSYWATPWRSSGAST